MGVIIEIPEDVLAGLRIPINENLEKRLRIELALRLYERGLASLGVARRICGLSKGEFMELLVREKIPLHYDEEELEHDVEVAEKFAEKI